MKKRLLIICSIIGVLLAGFQFPIYAETTTPDYSSSTSIITRASLDQYFYDNYELLPYIESSGSQYINTQINASSNLRIDTKISDLSGSGSIFGSISSGKNLCLNYAYDSNNYRFLFGSGENSITFISDPYVIFNITFDKNDAYINNNLINIGEFNFSDGLSLYIFGRNYGDSNNIRFGSFKLYNFSIYDYAANDGQGALIRDYYPARSKSGGIIGLYDAVSKTFVSTSGSVPFESPTNDYVVNFQITDFLTASLNWIGAIFEGINEMPIIWVFIAIALAGVMFRWARRIVHF